MEFKTSVAGIPCICRVTWYNPEDTRPISAHQIDPPDQEYFEFEILDRRVRPAPWLQRKVTLDIEADLLQQYKERLENDE